MSATQVRGNNLARIDRLDCYACPEVTYPEVEAGLAHTEVTTGPLARNSKCSFLAHAAVGDSGQPWTIHSLRLFAWGSHLDEALAALRAFTPAPMIFPRRWTNRETGEVTTLSALVRLDFADPDNTALLPLAEVAASLARFPWSEHPSLRVNRLDLASDHLVSAGPREVCDRIAELHLPYSRPYRGPRDAEPYLGIYHNGGKTRAPGVVVAHYPRREAYLYRHPEADLAAMQYCEHCVRQEIRFRGQGLRRRIGAGPMTLDVVFGSLAALLDFAARRLRLVFEAGILSPPPRDLEGEAALARAVSARPQP